MKIDQQRVFRIPIDELREVVKTQYGIDLSGVDPYLEGADIVFSINSENNLRNTDTNSSVMVKQESNKAQSRKKKRNRNRIKTRGWDVIAKITNSNGLVANIYEPLVQALEGRDIPFIEKKKIVRGLLASNGNNPKEESVMYFLKNTLEYLEKKSDNDAFLTLREETGK